MPTILGFHHAALSVANLTETIRWYEDKLGFVEEFRYEFPPALHTKVAFLRLGDLRLELFEVTEAAAMPASRADVSQDLHVRGMKHVGWRVDDLTAARAELEAKGVAFVTPTGEVPHSGGAHYAFLHDNNGILLELYEQPIA